MYHAQADYRITNYYEKSRSPTGLYASARDLRDPNFHYFTKGGALNYKHGTAKIFPLNYEPGLSIGDLATFPKVQKYHSKEEFEALFGEFFQEVEIKNRANNVTAVCRRPRPISADDLAESIRFEFNLPYPNGRLNLADEAMAAFSRRLAIPLGNP